MTHFIWYLEKEKRYDTEALFIDRVLNKEHFNEKNNAENVHQDPFLILVNNPKQPLHGRNSFLKRYFERG